MRLMPLSWSLGVVLVGMVLGWQVLNEVGVGQCFRDSTDLLMLCGGRLDPWVLPLTLAAALLLVALGIWRLVPPPRD
jgi:hypothetical protein